jgi:peptidoglycan/xylan/chitin deacetylase (PgdA/CDA1 family)
MPQSPAFTISLDFELFWGVRDHRTIENYGTSILGARKAIPLLLDLFREYEIHVTWATVGFLFYNNKIALQSDLPDKTPSYKNEVYSPYTATQKIEADEQSDPYHFGLSLIKKIQATPFQEISTHTYSHYYCLEEGQTIEEFKIDIRKAVEIAHKNGVEIKSIVFPRNQFNEDYLNVLKEYNIKIYRGNENSWLYEPRNREKEKVYRRLLRLLDSYVNISGHHVHDIFKINKGREFINIPSSRFLRPYSPKLKVLEGLKLNRIKKSMLAAALENKMFHLWWHPHNFGSYTAENHAFLKSILEYYLVLKKEYGMASLNMAELANTIYESK